MERLKEFGFEDGADRGCLWNLRKMEESGWIESMGDGGQGRPEGCIKYGRRN